MLDDTLLALPAGATTAVAGEIGSAQANDPTRAAISAVTAGARGSSINPVIVLLGAAAGA